MSRSITRGHQGFLYRVAERARRDTTGDRAAIKEEALKHGSLDFGHDGMIIINAVNLVFEWLDDKGMTESSFKEIIKEARRGTGSEILAQGLAAAACLRARQIPPARSE